jgi:hypothetical protein
MEPILSIAFLCMPLEKASNKPLVEHIWPISLSHPEGIRQKNFKGEIS